MTNGIDVAELENRWIDIKKMFNVYEENNDDTEDNAEFWSNVQKQVQDFPSKAFQIHSYADSTMAQPVSKENITAGAKRKKVDSAEEKGEDETKASTTAAKRKKVESVEEDSAKHQPTKARRIATKSKKVD